MNETTKVTNKGRKFFTIIPHVAQDKLNPYQLALYSHYVRVAGDGGTCWQSNKTISSATKMSIRKVQETRNELQRMGFISLESSDGSTVNVTILDIWDIPKLDNHNTPPHAPDAPPPMHHVHTPHAPDAPPPMHYVHTNKNPLKKNPEEEPSPPTTPAAAAKKNKKAPEKVSEDLKKTLQPMADALGISLETYAGVNKTFGYLKRWLADGLKAEQITAAAAAWNDSYLVKQKRQRGEEINPPTYSQLQELAIKKPFAPPSPDTSGGESKICPKCNNSGFIHQGYAEDGSNLGTPCDCPCGRAKQFAT